MDNATRRSFIVKATAFVGALAMTKATLAASADTDLISRMTWFNEPAASKSRRKAHRTLAPQDRLLAQDLLWLHHR